MEKEGEIRFGDIKLKEAFEELEQKDKANIRINKCRWFCS